MAAFESNAKPRIQSMIDAIGGYSGDQVMNLKNSRDVNENATYNRLIDQLQIAENTLNSGITCIQKDILQRNDYSSKLYTLQQEVEQARKTSLERKQTAEEAKERSMEVQNPYANTTWWETWFPLGRPIQKDNVPVLLSVSVLMLVFSLGIFLRFAGQELKFVPISPSVNSLLKNINPRKYP
jgi:leucyl-tRNA synthetase